MCVFDLALLFGVGPYTSLGYMSAPVILHCAQLLAGGPKLLGSVGFALVMGWFTFHGANFASLAIPK